MQPQKKAIPFIVCFTSLFIVCNYSWAQDPLSVLYSQQISPDSTFNSIQVLASDSLEGRESGKQGQKKAAAFISSFFQRIGLEPGVYGSFEQFHPLNLRSAEMHSVEVNQQFFLFMKDYFYAPVFRDTMMVLDSVHFLGYGISDSVYDDYKDQEVYGKVIMFCEGEPKDKKNRSIISRDKKPSDWALDWKKKLRIIYEKKPRLVLVITDSIDVIADSINYGKNTGELLRVNKAPEASPVVFITKEMARHFLPGNMEDELTKSIRNSSRKRRPRPFTVSTDAILKLTENTSQLMGQNIIGYLEGTDQKGEAVFITAHYDHLGIRDSSIYHGADDNASGTSAVMEIARIFKKAAEEGNRPRRNIYFMLVSGEEKGLLGSKYYVKRPVVPLANTVLDLNIDMIGRVDDKHDSLGQREYVYLIGSDKLSSDLHQISESINDSVTKLKLDYQFNTPGDPNRFYFRSDHYNFAKNNIPVIFYFNGTHPDYHRPSDSIEKIDTHLQVLRAQLVFLTAWEVANRAGRLRVDKKAPKE
ncbi:MAG TPA: M28 family peptidase [Bacteroidia bacterium]|nr:M28 family peptidase [Bacteroidia bacterium]